MEEGSAGNFLPNELFYRIALRRRQRNTGVPVGHLQLPRLQGDAAEPHALFDGPRVQYFLDTLVQLLKDALPGL